MMRYHAAMTGRLVFCAAVSTALLSSCWNKDKYQTPDAHDVGPDAHLFDAEMFPDAHLYDAGPPPDAQAVTGTWSNLSLVAPPVREYPALAYDGDRHYVILFGGETLDNVLSDTWIWNGFDWRLATPAHSPPERYHAALTYDANHHVLVLFGGTDAAASSLNDTWTWDGTDWTQQFPSTSPPVRASAAMTYDTDTQAVLLEGGVNGQVAIYNDTWAWDGSNWALLNALAKPSPAFGSALAYDDARHRAVLVMNGLPSQVWEWDGNTWTNKSPNDTLNERFDGANASYDTVNATVVSVAPATDGTMASFRWNGTAWTQQASSAGAIITDVASAYDASRSALVAYAWDRATTQASVLLDEVFEYSASTWSNPNQGTPSPRVGASMIYSAVDATMMMLGGAVGNFAGADRIVDLWTWDGSVWSQPSPEITPAVRSNAGIAFDSDRQQVVVFGGIGPTGALADTWLWDGFTWTQASPAHSPPPRFAAGMSFDALTGLVVLFGGTSSDGTLLGDTWTWNGSDWSLLSPATSPSPRAASAMTFDEARNQILLFGGVDSDTENAETWLFDGTSWTMAAVTGPSARSQAAIAWDPVRHISWIIGGANGNNSLDDFWTWDGTSWSLAPSDGGPPARFGATVGFDRAHGELLVFGGKDDTGALSDTYTFH